MHRFLKAVGFSDIQKRDLELILNEIIEHPDSMKVTKDSEEREFAEFTKEFAKDIGITVRGFYDEEDTFYIEYYFPYAKTDKVTTKEVVQIERYAEKEAYAGVCDEVHIGVALVFYLQNAIDFLTERRKSKEDINVKAVCLSALSVEGKILLPVENSMLAKIKTNQKYEYRSQLMAQAREGSDEAIEALTTQDVNLYSQISKRITKEDVFSIVSSTFMPYSIESDQYSILGEIVHIIENENILTQERLYTLTLNANNLIFNVTINQSDLLGKPEIGRRFKGYIWMQGMVYL